MANIENSEAPAFKVRHGYLALALLFVLGGAYLADPGFHSIHDWIFGADRLDLGDPTIDGSVR